jgi:hypothetical protein
MALCSVGVAANATPIHTPPMPASNPLWISKDEKDFMAFNNEYVSGLMMLLQIFMLNMSNIRSVLHQNEFTAAAAMATL